VREASVLAMLARDCGACHDSGQSAGGVGSITDIQSLVSSGLVVPGNDERSPLLESIRSGRMPPAGAASRPSVGEEWLLQGFIDGLIEPGLIEGCRPPAFPSVDEVYALLLADVLAQPEAQRPFLRYASLTDDDPRLCGVPLQQRRNALSEAVNGVSLDPEIHVPVPIDAGELVYRIDIRDYDWDRPLDLDGDGNVDHGDGWQAILAASGTYAVELRGPEADALREATGSTVPVLAGGALISAVSFGDVYYTLIGAEPNIFDTQLKLGIDVLESLLNGVMRRAGFAREADGEQGELVVSRSPQALPGRAFWSLEEQPTGDSESIYSDPFTFDRLSGQTIFNLPNGLQAYSAETLEGARLAASPRGCVGECVTPAADTIPAGCQGCHAGGVIPVRDQTRESVERFSGQFDAETLELVRTVYPLPAELDALMAADSAVHLAALERAGVPANGPDPLARVYFSFELEPLGAERAAAELGVTLAALRESLPLLPPGFAALGGAGGVIPRAVMTDGQGLARCVLHASSRNRPANCP
jgi:hypothetical protein